MTFVIRPNSYRAGAWNSLVREFPATENGKSSVATWSPAVNVSETEIAFLLELAMPGIEKDAIRLNVEKNILTISTEAPVQVAEGLKVHRREFGHNIWKRSFRLPANVEDNGISARYEAGILKLTLQKRPVRKVEVA